MQETKLVSRSLGSKTLTTYSMPSSQKTAEEMLTLMSAKFGKELTPPEAKSWKETLRPHPPEAIKWSFEQYIRTPPSEGQRKWFPEEWEILQLLGRWRMQQKDLEQQRQLEDARWTREQLRAEGELAGEEQVEAIQKRLLAVVQKWPEPLPTMRRVELEERIARARAKVTPALDLTSEEIQARREREREEIRKCQE
jgi:hypothetical protein